MHATPGREKVSRRPKVEGRNPCAALSPLAQPGERLSRVARFTPLTEIAAMNIVGAVARDASVTRDRLLVRFRLVAGAAGQIRVCAR